MPSAPAPPDVSPSHRIRNEKGTQRSPHHPSCCGHPRNGGSRGRPAGPHGSSGAGHGCGSGLHWTGFYAGVNAGYGWNTNDDDVVINGATYKVRRGWLRRRWPDRLQLAVRRLRVRPRDGHPVVDIGGDTSIPGLDSGGDDDNWFGTVRARVGYAFDRTLVYITGGLAYGMNTNRFGNRRHQCRLDPRRRRRVRLHQQPDRQGRRPLRQPQGG